MNISSLIKNDDAVSPVIGVILMVAITVILAAVIGTFVLGLGDQVQSTSPQASFTFEYSQGSPDSLDVVHDGGDAIAEDRLAVVISGATGTNSPNQEWALTDVGISDGSEVSAGTTLQVSDGNVNGGGSDLDLSSATVRVV